MGEEKLPTFDVKVTPQNLALATSLAAWPGNQTTANAKEWYLEYSDGDQEVKHFFDAI